MFVQYHCSGEHDAEMDEWMSEKESRCLLRAAGWKSPGKKNIIDHQLVMIYSISVLDLCNIESINHKKPKGIGVDASINDSLVKIVKVKGGKIELKPNTMEAITLAIGNGGAHEARNVYIACYNGVWFSRR